MDQAGSTVQSEPTPEAERIGRRNFRLGVASGALGQLSMGFIHPHLVLAAFVLYMTGSNALVGLAVTITWFGLRWPQLYLSSKLEHRPRKKPFYVMAVIARTLALTGMMVSMWLVGTGEGKLALVPFFIAYFVFRSCQGCGQLPVMDILGQTLDPRRLGGFFAWRAVIGYTLASVGGFFIIQPILDRVGAPMNYALLVLLALVLMSIGSVLFAMAHEDESCEPPRPRNMRETFAGAAQMLRDDSNYRAILIVRFLIMVNALALAFYVPFGVGRLGAVGMSGVFVGCMFLSRLLSSLVWGWLSDKRGNRTVLAIVGLLFAAAPLLALGAPRLPEVFLWSLPGTSVQLNLPICVYLLTLFLVGLSLQGMMIGVNAFVLEAAPPDRRPSYIAFISTVTMPMAFVPLIVGALIGSVPERLDILFGVVAVSGIATFLAALHLRDVRPRDADARAAAAQ